MSIKHLKLGKEYTVKEIGSHFKCKIKDHTAGWHIEERFVILFLTLDKEFMENENTPEFAKMSTREKRREIYNYCDFFDIQKQLFFWEGPTDLDESSEDIRSFIEGKKPFYLFVREYYKKEAEDIPYEKFTYAGKITYKSHKSKYESGKPVTLESKLDKIDDTGKLSKLYDWDPPESEIRQQVYLQQQKDDKEACGKWTKLDEGLKHEYKATFFGHKNYGDDEINKERCCKTICAFLNTSGGNLIIGVRDDSKTKQKDRYDVTGIEKDIKFKDKNDYKTRITTSIRSALDDKVIHGYYEVLIHECVNFSHICRIDVRSSPKVCRYKTRVYIRNGDTTQVLAKNEEYNFVEDRNRNG